MGETTLRYALVSVVFGSLIAGCAASTSDGGAGGGGSGSNYGGSGSGSGSGSDDSGVDPTYPSDHPRIYLAPNKARLQAALAAHTPAATKFQSVVDAWMGGADVYGFSAWNAALLFQLTGQQSYCTKAVATIDAQVTTAEQAIAGGTAPNVAFDSYLYVGDQIGDLALTYDWCFDSITAAQKTRWLAYANQAVWNVWHPTQAKWGNKTITWSGWATSDPSDNYYYSFLRATMLLGLAEKGDDPQGDTWITQFRDTKILGELVPTFDSDLVGGGSREGTGYGQSMKGLWMLYDFWHATTGEGLAGKTPHTKASMRAFMHQIVPTLDRIAPTGDQARDSTASFFDYHRQYLQELVTLYPSEPMAGPAQTLLANSSVPAMTLRFMAVSDFLYENVDVQQAPMTGMATAYYAPGIGELYARSGWDKHATWINMIAGPYTQSHAHQDQGSLMIYKDGWLSYDTVVDSKSGLTQPTTAHSLVRIDNGGSPIPQRNGTTSTLVGLHRGTGWLYAAADLTPAYQGSTAVSRVQREIVYLEPDTVIVYDRVASASGTSQTWQLATPKTPSISGASATITNAHTLHVQRLAPASATSAAHSMTSDSSDYTSGFRLDETAAGGDNRYLHVLSIDNAVTSATANGDSSVTVTLSSGQTATVAFDRANPGATLTLGGVTTALPATVDTLPE